MTTTQPLAPIYGCPFCGDHAVSFQTKDGSWHVSCEAQIDEECRGIDSGELDGFINEQFAIEAWNKRTPSVLPGAARQIDITDKPLWFVWSNEHKAWWRAESSGYAPAWQVEEAGRYTWDECLKCCQSRSYAGKGEPPEVPVPSPELEALLSGLPPPSSVQAEAVAQEWLDEANEMPGSIPEQIMACQLRLCADRLRKLSKTLTCADPDDMAIDICHECGLDDNENNIRDISAIIRKHIQAPGIVAEGYVMVPIEPTDEMLLTMLRAFHADKPEVLEEVMDMSDLSDIQAKHLRDGYKAMLSSLIKAVGEKR